MLGVFESFTWPLRKAGWWIEEKVVWRLADAFRISGNRTASRPQPTVDSPPAQSAGETAPSRILLPLRFARSGDLRIAIATVAVAAAAGIGIAAVVGGSGGDSTLSAAPSGAPAAASVPQPPSSVYAPPAGKDTTLQGVAPNFKSLPKSSTSRANGATTSPTPGINAKPSSIPPGVSDDVAALSTARNFAGAFVLYEIGKSNSKVRQAFTRTATPALAKALRDRPPRLPSSVKVPQAKVENVVLGARHGRQVDASVSLLRLGDISELRLTLTQIHGNWLVSEVRG